MSRPVIYDVTRLSTRFSRPAPNGIDRVDLAYAQHFLSPQQKSCGALFNGLGQPRGIPNDAASKIVSAIADHWRETRTAAEDPVFVDLARKLGLPIRDKVPKPNAATTVSPNRQRARRSIQALATAIPLWGGDGVFPGRSLIKTAPEGAVYLNTSQFPLWIDWYFQWLDQRPDMKAVFFLHDLLPIDYPEFFPVAEEFRHRRRLEVLIRRADAIIVASDTTAERLQRYCHELGARLPRIAVIRLPVDDIFRHRSRATNTRSGGRPFFVTVGTIEPRKNHLLLLHVWRALVEELGAANTPRLLLVGARGWEYENVLDLLERCDQLQETVLEVRGLSTPGLVELLSHAQALLLPTLAEGFGLPLSEALAGGVPVVASKISAFEHEQGVRLIDPLDGPAWRQAVLDGAFDPPAIITPRSKRVECEPASWSLYFRHIQQLIHNI